MSQRASQRDGASVCVRVSSSRSRHTRRLISKGARVRCCHGGFRLLSSPLAVVMRFPTSFVVLCVCVCTRARPHLGRACAKSLDTFFVSHLSLPPFKNPHKKRKRTATTTRRSDASKRAEVKLGHAHHQSERTLSRCGQRGSWPSCQRLRGAISGQTKAWRLRAPCHRCICTAQPAREGKRAAFLASQGGV